MKGLLLALLTLFLIPVDLFAWTNGELLIWMDADRGQALKAIAAKTFEDYFGLKVTIESPEKITDSFPIAAQMAKGPDIVIWAHDKVGEWADAGLIAPVQISEQFKNKFFPKAWEAVLHGERIWGYPIALETVTLIYNKNLLDGSPPTQLSDLVSLNEKIKKEHPGVTAILWDYNSSYYSWGILASAARRNSGPSWRFAHRFGKLTTPVWRESAPLSAVGTQETSMVTFLLRYQVPVSLTQFDFGITHDTTNGRQQATVMAGTKTVTEVRGEGADADPTSQFYHAIQPQRPE